MLTYFGLLTLLPKMRFCLAASAAKLAAAAAMLPPQRCHAVAAYATTALPTPPTPRSCQAAASILKLATAANTTLLPSCHFRRQAGRCCHRASTATAVPFVSTFILITVIVAVSVLLVDC